MKERGESGIDRLTSIMARLREAGGCPWDREQTHDSLKKYAIEEVYELVDAIDSCSDEKMKEELGDVLLQVVFHAQIALERGAFDFDDVANRISDKLVHRHPHVFGDVKVEGVSEVLANWEDLKRKEKPGEESRFGGLPRELPALFMSYRIAEKAPESCPPEEALLARLGSFEVDRANIGEFLHAFALLAWRWGIDPEEALRAVNERTMRCVREK